jgi:hypothetical protein
MQNSDKRIQELKIKLVSATEFSDVFNYFYDHLGENQDFMGTGVRRHNSYIQQVLVACAEEVLHTKNIVVRKPFMIYLAKQKFYHGAIRFNETLSNFFYFEDINVGLLAISNIPSTGATAIIRFSLSEIGKTQKRSYN